MAATRKSSDAKLARDVDAELEAQLDKGPFTAKQEKFVLAYMRLADYGRAALEAGYECNRWNASTIGSRVAKVPHVRKALDTVAKAARAKARVDAETVLGELLAIGLFNPANITRPDGQGGLQVDLSQATAADLAAISEIIETSRPLNARDPETGETLVERRLQIKTHSKVQALDLLGKHLKLFTDKVEVSGQVDVASIIQKHRRERLERQRQEQAEQESEA